MQNNSEITFLNQMEQHFNNKNYIKLSEESNSE